MRTPSERSPRQSISEVTNPNNEDADSQFSQVISIPPAPIKVIERSIQPLAAKALKFAYDDYLSQPYKETNTKGTVSNHWSWHPIMVKKGNKFHFYQTLKSFYEDGHTKDTLAVYRPNHGLCHTAKTMVLVNDVVEFNKAHASDPVKQYINQQINTPEKKQKFITKLQIAMAFYVSGREGEEGWEKDLDRPYHKYRKSSAKNFKKYIRDNELIPNLFSSEEEVKIYAEHLTHSYIDDGFDIEAPENAEAAAIKAILYGAHCADLSRLWSPSKINKDTLWDLFRAVPADKVDSCKKHPKANLEIIHQAKAIFHKAALMGIQMGDSVISVCNEQGDFVYYENRVQPLAPSHPEYAGNFPRTNPELFLQFSTSPQKCVNLIGNNITLIKQTEAEVEKQELGIPIPLTANNKAFDKAAASVVLAIGGAILGGVLGTLIPIPGVGTAMGIALGAAIGGVGVASLGLTGVGSYEWLYKKNNSVIGKVLTMVGSVGSGATAGAIVGAILGTFIPIPGLGTIIGAGIGAAVGATATLLIIGLVKGIKACLRQTPTVDSSSIPFLLPLDNLQGIDDPNQKLRAMLGGLGAEFSSQDEESKKLIATDTEEDDVGVDFVNTDTAENSEIEEVTVNFPINTQIDAEVQEKNDSVAELI
ncbi:Homologous to SidE substrate of Dot/Icm secretion system [Legionella beliardensis]|uniref:Homologous to SidE substrate of Dot/Icm secretion system n=1 Tax=Legionella beliardensis TaxID=91822 RepID=A0A378I4Z7_9GAMM|nr:SidE phosphodiesterase domain-containing protein [Legionella beliardensis]STX29741.1 Homologous to SidE substrate of Dot/Icm secretion system [Legionella beliardensis]